MESSQLTTGDDGEECNSNESGWTMYLASPMRSDDAKANGSEESNVEDGSGCSDGRSSRKGNKNSMYGDDGDYDSLASDASTGPAEVKVPEGKEEKGYQLTEVCKNQHSKDKQDEIHTKVSTSCNKRAGKMKKGYDKTTRRGYSMRRSSSKTSLFW